MSVPDLKGKGKVADPVTSKPTDDDVLPWVEKYRPSTLDQVSGQEHIISTVRKFISVNRLPHLLFYGPPGTGKTTTILAIARELYGEKNMKHMVLELNASDDRGIDVVRNQVKTFASTRQMFSDSKYSFKLVILDEADAMTNVAQNALRRVIEKYTVHTRFCIIANYAHKLNPALLSRCTRFRFSPMTIPALDKRLQFVIDAEHIKITKDARKALVKLSKGDMRKVLNVLQPCYYAVKDDDDQDTEMSGTDPTEQKGYITEDMIYSCVGSPRPSDVKLIMDTILNDDWTTCYNAVNKLKSSRGLALADVLEVLAVEFETFELKPEARIALLDGLSEIEFRLAAGGNERIQTSATIGVVKHAIDIQAGEVR